MDAVDGGGGDDGAHVLAELEFAGDVGDLVDDRLDVADGDHQGGGHAALAGAAVGGGDDGGGGEFGVGVGDDEQVVLGAAEAEHALAEGGAPCVEDLGDLGGADEGHGLDVGVVDEGLDGGLAAVDGVEDAVGEAGLLQEAGELEGAVGDDLGGFEDEGVPGGEGLGEHPQGDHDGEVEGDDAGDHAEGLVGDAAIDAARDVELFALGHVLEGEAELEALDALEHVALGLGEDLAVLVGDEPGELVEVALHEGLEAEQDLDALLERGVAPAGEGGLRGGDGGGDVGGSGEGDVAHELGVARVVDRERLAGGGGGLGAGDPVVAGGVGGEVVATGGERRGGWHGGCSGFYCRRGAGGKGEGRSMRPVSVVCGRPGRT